MMTKTDRKGYYYAVPGFIIQTYGGIWLTLPIPFYPGIIGPILLIIGTVLYSIGCGSYTSNKGYSRLWGGLALLNWVAIPIVVFAFRNRYPKSSLYQSRNPLSDEQLTSYYRKSICYGLPGFLGQIAGAILVENYTSELQFLTGAIIVLLGTILLFVSYGYYAKAKNSSFIWGFLAIFNWVGLLYLILILNFRPSGKNRKKGRTEKRAGSNPVRNGICGSFELATST